MRPRTLGTSRLVYLAAAALLAHLCPPTYAQKPPVGGRSAVRTLAADVNMALGVTASEVVTIRAARGLGGAATVHVPIQGRPCSLELVPFSNRTDDYKVLAQIDDGSYVEMPATPVTTMRGTVPEIEGAVVAATLTDVGLIARVLLPDGSSVWVEPIFGRVAAAGANQHAVYRDQDIIPSGGTCQVLPGNIAGAVAQFQAQESLGTIAGTGPTFAELAIDADFEYFLRRGSSDAATETRIESVINTVNLQYERDVNIRHVITTIITRTSAAASPYTDCDFPVPNDPNCEIADNLLFRFRDHWVAEQGGVHRDVAQLFTGKSIVGGTVGIAWPNSICSSMFGYSVVESDCCGQFACTTDLSAHELGHNWSAGHCSCSTPGFTMNATLTCSNRFHPSLTIPDITFFRDGVTPICLAVDELRRVAVSAPADTVVEGDTLQFTATADFLIAPDEDVTSQAVWTVDPPTVGTIDGSGLLTAAGVTSDTCATVTGSFTFDGTTRSRTIVIMITDANTAREILLSVPTDGAIDARQPTNPLDTTNQGWQSVDLVYNGDTCLLAVATFGISQAGGIDAAPVVAGFEQLGARTVRLTFDKPLEPGTRATITDTNSNLSVTLGFLPGDVNADGVTDTNDVFELHDALNEIGPKRPIWSTDLDRSSQPSPADLLRLIDLFNGAEGYDEWFGRSLPP